MHSTRPALPVQHLEWVEAYREQCAEFERLVFPVLDKDLRPQAKRLFSGAETLVDFKPALLHADLGPEHLLVRDGRLAGVIDWGDARVGDPALDYAMADQRPIRGLGSRSRSPAGEPGSTTASHPGTKLTTACSQTGAVPSARGRPGRDQGQALARTRGGGPSTTGAHGGTARIPCTPGSGRSSPVSALAPWLAASSDTG